MPVRLVCHRLADMTRVHPEQIERRCSACGAGVAVFPSGQAVLAKRANAVIQCHVCGLNGTLAVFVAASAEELRREIAETVEAGHA